MMPDVYIKEVYFAFVCCFVYMEMVISLFIEICDMCDKKKDYLSKDWL